MRDSTSRKPASGAHSAVSPAVRLTNPIAQNVHRVAPAALGRQPSAFINPSKFSGFRALDQLARKLHSYSRPRLRGTLGWRLTVLFGSPTETPITSPKKKRTLLPLLTVLFLFSYGLMTLLIVEQGKTIDSQHSLIQALLTDSRELWAMRGKAVTGSSIQLQKPTNQVPSTHGQAPSVQIPSTQVPQHHLPSRAGKSAKPYTQVPPMPASDLGDQRRVVFTI
jgi:hypothetical protein